MSAHDAVIVTEEICARIPDILHQAGIDVEPYPDLGQFKVLRCRRGNATVLLSMLKPRHWVEATDQRSDKVVMAVITASLWKFWRLPADRRLKARILTLLRPHAWSPHQ